MREIKFRAWIERYQKYMPVAMIYFEPILGKIDYIEVVATGGDWAKFYPEEVILEQYTGLKDKNGNMIFEGDIVKINGWWNAAGPAGYNENQTVVKFNDEFCGFNPMCDYDCDCGVYHPADECEVIGNIHDNPELLHA